MVNNCIPLMLTNNIGNKYPNVWEKIDKIYEKNADSKIGRASCRERV